MNRFLLLILLLLPATALAGWQRSITVEWEHYTPPSAPAVSGFRLYQEDVSTCQWAGADITTGECTVTLTKATTAFTLTALFADGSESPHSNSFAFTDPGEPAPTLTAPTLFKIKIK